MNNILTIERLDVRYGRTQAVQAVSIDLAPGEIVTVLGANGAGKSSLLKAIQGTVRPISGRVIYKDIDITAWSAPRRVANGLVLVPEGRQIFVSLTVHDNLLMGAYTRHSSDAAAVRTELDAIYTRFPNLAQRRDMLAQVLSGGEQQMLAIGRALLAKPAVIMLDEPSLGLSPRLVTALFQLIRDLNRDGLSILLVEQNTQMALASAHRGYVLELGQIALAGPAPRLAKDPRLAAAYLGSG